MFWVAFFICMLLIRMFFPVMWINKEAKERLPDVIAEFGNPTRLVDNGRTVSMAYRDEGLVFKVASTDYDHVYSVYISSSGLIDEAYINNDIFQIYLLNRHRTVCRIYTKIATH